MPSRLPDERPIGLTYSRISDPGDPREASMASQEEASVALLESKGFQVPPEYRFREQQSGMESIYDRAVLIHCRKLVAEGKVNAWACYHTDRLAREPKELISIVSDNKRHGVDTLFVKLSGQFDGRFGEAVLYLAGMASAVEWDQIRDRTMRGRLEILNAGKWLGGGAVRYGYILERDERGRITPARRRVAHPEHAAIVRRIFEECAAGDGGRLIAGRLNAEGVPSPRAARGTRWKNDRETFWSRSVVRSIIKERTYIGESSARRTKVVGRHREDGTKQKRMASRPKEEWVPLANADVEPLVSVDLFERANAALSGRTNHPLDGRARKREPLLRGRLFCGGCGRVMVGCSRQRMAGSCAYYRCTSQDLARGAQRKGCVSSSKYVRADTIEDAVWTAILDRLFQPEWLEAQLAKLGTSQSNAVIERDLANWTKRKATAQRKLDRLLTCELDELEAEVKQSVRERIRAISEEIKAAKAQILALQQRLVPPERLEKTVRSIRRRVAHYKAMACGGELAEEQRRDVVMGLGISVTLNTDGSIVIDFNMDAAPAIGCAEDGDSS
jgi:DNA invertase Pin-like site-specific DNA recombinase